ncbi:hypothetical protein J6S55_00385 [Candidatus Saccharibacteria bacterium]|nr:hypothetical protein [Candidatus Saccharibacteria bacterium]
MKQMKWLKFLIAFLVPVAGVMVCNNSLDSDTWYVLAEGREIVTNGIYYEDQLSMHEGLEVTVQNYGFAAIFYLIYSVFGPVGIYIGMLLLNVLLCYLIYKVCMVVSNKNENLSLLIMILTDLLLGRWFVVTRAQMVSYCIMMLLIYLLELYIRTNKSKYLWWIPVLSLLQINLHASLWPIIILIIGVYIIDSFKSKKLHLQGYRTKPLLLVLAISFVVGFLNPYGFKMMTFILTSYGVPEAHDTIQELKPFAPFMDSTTMMYCATFSFVLILYIFEGKKNMRMRWLLMIFGFLALALNTIKGLSQLILVLLFPLAAVYKDVWIEKWKTRKIRWMVLSWMGILSLVMIITVTVAKMFDSAGFGKPPEYAVAALDALDKDVGDIDKKTLKIYAGFDGGGYAIYRGYKTYMDSRMEVFLKANNGKEDIFVEWYDLQHNKIEKTDFLDKYNFDYLLLYDDDRLFDLDDVRYEEIYEDRNDDWEEIVRIYKRQKSDY